MPASSSPLRKFLNAHRASTNPTHLSLTPNGKYRIEDDELHTLYSLVASTPGPHHILEGHNESKVGPLLIDLDFEYPDEPRFHTRQYTHAEVAKFVEAIHGAITHFFGGEKEGVEYVVSEKPAPTIETGKRVKDGIHIVGKGLFMTFADQHKLRLYALEKHFLQNSFCVDYVRNKMDSVYDKAVIETNSWYLLGCSKPGRDPYLPTLSFVIDEDELFARRVEASFYSIADLSIRSQGEAIVVRSDLRSAWGADQYDKKKVDGVFDGEKREALGFVVAH